MNIKNKIISCFLTAILFVNFVLPCFAVYGSDTNITSAKTAVSTSTASLKWSLKLGDDYKNAPSVMTIVDETVLVMAGKTLYKLNKDNGKTLASAEMVDSPSYGTVPVTYAD